MNHTSIKNNSTPLVPPPDGFVPMWSDRFVARGFPDHKKIKLRRRHGTVTYDLRSKFTGLRCKETGRHVAEAFIAKEYDKRDTPSTILDSPRALLEVGPKIRDLEQRNGFRFYEKQRQAATALGCVDGALLASEVGTGKTLIAIAAIAVHEPRITVIVGPIGTTRGKDAQWVKEIRKFSEINPIQIQSIEDIPKSPRGNRIDPGVYLTDPQSFFLNRDGELADHFRFLVDMVVFDESQMITKDRALITEKLVNYETEKRLALSATPMMHRPVDMVPILRWVSHDQFDISPWHVDNTFTAQIRLCGQKVKTPTILTQAPEFYKRIAPWFISITKKDIRPDIPEVHEIPVPLDFASKEERRHYISGAPRPINRSLADDNDDDSVSFVEASKTFSRRLNHVAGPTDAKSSWVVRKCEEIVFGEQEQIVVFTSRIKMGDLICEKLASSGITFSRIDSSKRSEEYSVEADRFKRKQTQVMVMGMRCASAFSFDQCRYAIATAVELRSGYFTQAIGRIHRITSKRDVAVWVLIYNHTIEVDIYQNSIINRSNAHCLATGNLIH